VFALCFANGAVQLFPFLDAPLAFLDEQLKGDVAENGAESRLALFKAEDVLTG
jgi:hypothetical protein